ncbi:MAG: hypothetical protein WCI45_02965, partial [Desulfuromonadales bacterium]
VPHRASPGVRLLRRSLRRLRAFFSDGRSHGFPAHLEIMPFSDSHAVSHPLADVAGALSCQRWYKEAWNENEVLENIRGEAGRQFDPELVGIFLENIDTFRQIEKHYPDQSE